MNRTPKAVVAPNCATTFPQRGKRRSLPEEAIVALVAKAIEEDPKYVRVIGRPDEIGKNNSYWEGIKEDTVLVLDAPNPHRVFYLSQSGEVRIEALTDLLYKKWLRRFSR